jgi:signal transduction histidine kinase
MNQTLLALEGRDPKELLKPKKRPDKIREFIADILFYFRRQFVERNKRLLAGEIDNSWTFNVDRGMLREVVENLVANALEHGGEETRLDVELQSGRVFIHVQDDGGGISDFDRARIFAPFYRKSILEQTRPLRGRGLALATLLMRTQGGGIYFKTSEGRYFRDDGEACEPLPFQPSEWSSDFVVEVGQE